VDAASRAKPVKRIQFAVRVPSLQRKGKHQDDENLMKADDRREEAD
jgi:hypothetical protein